jgi:hypothetical protein
MEKVVGKLPHEQNVFVQHCQSPMTRSLEARHHRAITVEICVCCFIYKLAQGANFHACNKLFAIRKSTIFLVLHEFVDAFISKYMFLIYWPWGEVMKLVVDEFQAWFGLPNVQDAIDGIHIVKPFTYFEDYYYHKFGGYSVVAQANKLQETNY